MQQRLQNETIETEKKDILCLQKDSPKLQKMNKQYSFVKLNNDNEGGQYNNQLNSLNQFQFQQIKTKQKKSSILNIPDSNNDFQGSTYNDFTQNTMNSLSDLENVSSKSQIDYDLFSEIIQNNNNNQYNQNQSNILGQINSGIFYNNSNLNRLQIDQINGTQNQICEDIQEEINQQNQNKYFDSNKKNDTDIDLEIENESPKKTNHNDNYQNQIDQLNTNNNNTMVDNGNFKQNNNSNRLDIQKNQNCELTDFQKNIVTQEKWSYNNNIKQREINKQIIQDNQYVNNLAYINHNDKNQNKQNTPINNQFSLQNDIELCQNYQNQQLLSQRQQQQNVIDNSQKNLFSIQNNNNQVFQNLNRTQINNNLQQQQFEDIQEEHESDKIQQNSNQSSNLECQTKVYQNNENYNNNIVNYIIDDKEIIQNLYNQNQLCQNLRKDKIQQDQQQQQINKNLNNDDDNINSCDNLNKNAYQYNYYNINNQQQQQHKKKRNLLDFSMKHDIVNKNFQNQNQQFKIQTSNTIQLKAN